eukprot:443824_1
MKYILLLIITTLSTIYAAETNAGSNWAVLIAGSNSYYNYRHQSDISHSYQILTKLGNFPPSHIITMMYDDVAWSDSNPFPGQLFNEPGGSDVYTGIHIDYKAEDVTADNFLSVLKGTPIANRPELPVLNHTLSTDNIFIYYSDHGAVGLIAMPSGPPLYADDLHKTFHYMHDNKMYNEMVFYLEACESGSMFDQLLDDTLSIFATTAATPDEPSYAFYYNDTLGTYMADEYSIRWMQDSTDHWKKDESLINQFIAVQGLVVESHPQMYGDKSFEDATIHDFQEFEYVEKYNKKSYKFKSNKIKKYNVVENEYIPSVFDPEWIPKYATCRDVKLSILQKRYLLSDADVEKEHWKRLVKIELTERNKIRLIFDDIMHYIFGRRYSEEDMHFEVHDMNILQWDCFKKVYTEFENICEEFNDFGLKYVKYLVHLCHMVDSETIIDAFEQTCS